MPTNAWQTVLDAIASVLGVVLIACVPMALATIERWTGTKLSDSDRAIVEDAAERIAGVLKILIVQGTVKMSDLHENNPTIKAVVMQNLFPRVETALKRMPESKDDLARRAIAKLGADHQTMTLLQEATATTSTINTGVSTYVRTSNT